MQNTAIESPQPYSALAKQPTAPTAQPDAIKGAIDANEAVDGKEASDTKEADDYDDKQEDAAAKADLPAYFKVLLPLFLIGFYLFAFLAMDPFFSARIGNVIWNGTRLGPMRFESTLSARRLSFITITNWLGIIFTLGFFEPFAAVRTAKYRAE